MVIEKSKGVTQTERLLADLCERSFLKLWSYPNPVKDDKNELCDLLAVFENHVFIFFDRESKQLTNLNKDPLVNWERWKKKTIDAQIRTAHGAENYIKSGRSIYLDNMLKVAFPLPIDINNVMIHKIIIAHGAKEACLEFSKDNVFGSLAIRYGNEERCGSDLIPFIVHLNKDKPVHVLDSHNLGIVLGELDTFFDFSSYLDAKIKAIQKFDMLAYCGEEDLLAHYFLNYDEINNCHFIGPKKEEGVNCVYIGEGEWQDFIKLEIYKNKKSADQESYFWDKLIQKTCKNALSGTLMGDGDVFKGESAIHEMAKEPRFSRRALSANMLRAIRKFPESPLPMRNLSFMPSFYGGVGYVFLQLKIERDWDYENEYRPIRRALLEIACGVTKNKFPELKKIIGIAIDAPKFAEINSEDFILMKCDDWPDELKNQYEEANRELGFYNSGTGTYRKNKVVEFPNIKNDSSDI